MRQTTVNAIALVAVVLGALFIAAPAQALPRDWVIINYYDCDFNLMGYDFRDCGGAWHHVGNTTAASYRETEQAECSSGTPTYYAFEEWSLANQQWQPYGGGTSDYCQRQAVGAC